MNILVASLSELARAGKLFIGLCNPVLPLATETPSGASYESAKVFLKVVGGDVAPGIEASPWQSQVYVPMAPGTPSAQSVVVTASRQVFGCLWAPPTPSLNEPLVVSAPEALTADGYVWMHLYNIPQAVMGKFHQPSSSIYPISGELAPAYASSVASQSFSPLEITDAVARLVPLRAGVIPRLVKSEGVLKAAFIPAGAISYAERQYVVVEAAAETGSGATISTTCVAGEVVPVVSAGGSGYGVVRVHVRGDGVGAAFTATVESGVIVAVTVVEPGLGYTWADVVVTAGANSSFGEVTTMDPATCLVTNLAVVSKYIEALDDAGAENLTAKLFVASRPVAADRVVRPGEVNPLGAQSPVMMTAVTTVGAPGSYSLRLSTHINTVIRFGS